MRTVQLLLPRLLLIIQALIPRMAGCYRDRLQSAIGVDHFASGEGELHGLVAVVPLTQVFLAAVEADDTSHIGFGIGLGIHEFE